MLIWTIICEVFGSFSFLNRLYNTILSVKFWGVFPFFLGYIIKLCFTFSIKSKGNYGQSSSAYQIWVLFHLHALAIISWRQQLSHQPTGCFLSEIHIKHTPRLIPSIPICEQWAFLFNTREMESRQHYPVYHARIKEQLLSKPLCRYSVCSLHTGNGQKDHFTNVDVFLVRLEKAFLCYCRGVNKKVGIRCMCLFKWNRMVSILKFLCSMCLPHPWLPSWLIHILDRQTHLLGCK